MYNYVRTLSVHLKYIDTLVSSSTSMISDFNQADQKHTIMQLLVALYLLYRHQSGFDLLT